MATKSMGEKLHMKMDEGGSILQHQALPKAQEELISRLFYAMERAHEILGDVTENGGYATSQENSMSSSTSNLVLEVDPIAQSTIGLNQ